MIEKQQQLTFNKGITNVPSDAICSDGSLEESVGLVADNGELRVIQKPATFMTSVQSTQKLIYVHVLNDDERYISLQNSSVYWGVNSSGQYQSHTLLFNNVSGTPKVTSIGKTLIISDASGTHFFLWKDNTYEALTYPFPQIGMDVKLEEPDSGVSGYTPYGYYVQNSFRADGVILFNYPNSCSVASGKEEVYSDMVVALYSKNLHEIEAKKSFAKPFAVRMALELYDGTYTFITNPVLLFPSLTMNTCCATDGLWDGDDPPYTLEGSLYLHTRYAHLLVRQTTDYRDYRDIIKDVVLFVTRGVDIYNTTTIQPFEFLGDGDDVTVGDGISGEGPLFSEYIEYRTFKTTFPSSPFFGLHRTYSCLNKRTRADIKKDLEGDTIFYKLCSLGLAPISTFTDVGNYSSDVTFQNLTVQEQLGDDYYSRCKLVPDMMYAYNSRLNLAGVSRGVFEGFGFFMPLDGSDSTYDFYVQLQLDTETVWVKHTESTRQKQGIYFFYPDSRAKHVSIYKWYTGWVCDADLKESESLNGAYYFREYPSSSTGEITISGVSTPSPVKNYATEFLPNYILQSEPDNPFVFKAAGYFKVGTGKIVGMSSITQALSEGQFGQYPLLVFSESGIWSLSVGSTGYYTSVHPMSREVPLLDNPCITQTDGAVFFASKKGLMVIVGSQVKCVSEQLSGKVSGINDGYNISELDFPSYLSGSFIAYDYRDSLLWIFNNGTGFEDYNWVYSIKNGTFSKFLGTRAFNNVVSFYPDSLLQRTDGLFSLMQRDNINDDNSTYTATLITRPMKLENALALKSIMEVRHIMDMEGSVSLKIYASNNLKHAANTWVQLTSLRGTPWKYYKFEYTFTGLKATDRYAGTLVVTQERRTDKLR